MKTIMTVFWLTMLLGLSRLACAATSREMTYHVDNLERTALMYVPASAMSKPTPVVFVFHGQGGSSRNADRSFHIEDEWPDAIIVYMQGLPTVGQLSDQEGARSGWQSAAGDNVDRDLKFFDEALANLKKHYQVDARHIYSTGHSNGEGFTYLLWLTRGNIFAAVAPCAAVAR
jgi:polyhydroxybutyrate depolymerase